MKDVRPHKNSYSPPVYNDDIDWKANNDEDGALNQDHMDDRKIPRQSYDDRDDSQSMKSDDSRFKRS